MFNTSESYEYENSELEFCQLKTCVGNSDF